METGAERESRSEYTYEVDAAGRPAGATEFPAYLVDEEELHTDPAIHPKVKDHIHNREVETETEPPAGRRSALQGRMTHVRVATQTLGTDRGALSCWRKPHG